MKFSRKYAPLPLDVLFVGLAIVLRLWALGPGAHGDEQMPEGTVPSALIFAGDDILHGPDAGDWAIAARTLEKGDIPDIRRLPLYPRLTAAAPIEGDLVQKGHWMNHLLSLGVIALTYLLGVFLHGRGVGFGAALLVAISPKLILTQALFGVDPTFRLSLMILLCGTLFAARKSWPTVIVAAIGAGLCLSTHYLGLLFVTLMAVPQLPWHAPDKNWKQRLLSAGLRLAIYGAIAFAIFKVMLAPYPPMELRDITEEYAVGILSSLDRADIQSAQWWTPLWLALSRVPAAMVEALTDLATPITRALPIPKFLALMGMALGALGLKRKGKSFRIEEPITLLFFLLPLVGLVASNSPERYRLYIEPLSAVLFFGGLTYPLKRLTELKVGPWLGQVVSGLLAIGLTYTMFPILKTTWPGPSTDAGRHQREMGLMVKKAFPGEGPIVTTFQEIRFYSDRWGCMHDPCSEDFAELDACIQSFAASCGGFGDVPYHIQLAGPRGFANRANPLLEAWVMSVGEEVGQVKSNGRTSALWRVPKGQMPIPEPTWNPARR